MALQQTHVQMSQLWQHLPKYALAIDLPRPPELGGQIVVVGK